MQGTNVVKMVGGDFTGLLLSDIPPGNEWRLEFYKKIYKSAIQNFIDLNIGSLYGKISKYKSIIFPSEMAGERLQFPTAFLKQYQNKKFGLF